MRCVAANHGGISGPEAAQRAGISYRQLDYWARQKWVVPSIEAGTGRQGRRRYSTDDVIRLVVLRKLGTAGLDVGAVGPLVRSLSLHGTSDLVVVAAHGPDATGQRAWRLVTVQSDRIVEFAHEVAGPCVVVDVSRIRRELGFDVIAYTRPRDAGETRTA